MIIKLVKSKWGVFIIFQLKQLEEIRGANYSPKSSYASTASSGMMSIDFSEESLEKHCRPVNEVMMEVEKKGTLIDRLFQAEDRILKVRYARTIQLNDETNILALNVYWFL